MIFYVVLFSLTLISLTLSRYPEYCGRGLARDCRVYCLKCFQHIWWRYLSQRACCQHSSPGTLYPHSDSSYCPYMSFYVVNFSRTLNSLTLSRYPRYGGRLFSLRQHCLWSLMLPENLMDTPVSKSLLSAFPPGTRMLHGIKEYHFSFYHNCTNVNPIIGLLWEAKSLCSTSLAEKSHISYDIEVKSFFFLGQVN